MAAGIGMAANAVLAIIKIIIGIVGNSYALVADGIESTTDIVSSFVVWTGLKVSALPADEDHPYGHGKAEPIAGVIVAGALLGAAGLIAAQSAIERDRRIGPGLLIRTSFLPYCEQANLKHTAPVPHR